ncbi:ABC transporter permease [Planotetraspora thailandica]|uniref:ABC transporter permease n=1 Tax=Planotetraspora thailandica TaxID=487172 RepID=A0A8J3V3V8_9ACTN|nr:FtsX-like permease family protein [Planotetraspora thailandica]GII56336.1 ABC transporter permease [Planotetraspora thailandica]
MLRTTLAGLVAHRLRLLLTALAITLGVGFIAGTFVLTDTIDAGFSKSFAAAADKIDVAVVPGDAQLTASMLTKIRAVRGVKDAQPYVFGDAALIGRDGKAVGDFPTAGVSIPALRLDVKSGTAPSADDQALVDTSTAEEQGLRVGDTIGVLDHKDVKHDFRLVGIFDVGIDGNIAGRGAVAFTPATAQRMTGAAEFKEIDVTTAGPSREDLRTAVAAALGTGLKVKTGDQAAADMASENGANTDFLKLGLLLFGLISLLVAGLVIYNTFGILVVQRTRELALLRCIGATRRQVFGSILLESAVVGLLSAVLGLGVGLGLGAIAVAVLNNVGADVPTGTVELSPQTIAIGLATGLLMTVVAALLPARQATKVAPVAALRTQVEERTFRAGVARIVFSVLFALAGGGLTARAVTSKPGDEALITAMAGGVLVFFAVLVLGPVMIKPLSGVAGWVPARLFGVPGRLALENSRRDPKRSATTTIALTVGVTLMTFMAVLTTTVRATSEKQLDEQFAADYQIATQTSSGTMPRSVAESLRGRPEFSTVAEIREKDGTLNGQEYYLGSMTQAALTSGFTPTVTSGSLNDFPPGTIAVADYVAKNLSLAVGDDVTVGAGSVRFTAKLVAVMSSNDLLAPSVLLPEKFFDQRFRQIADSQVLINIADGVNADKARQIVDDATQAYPAVKVRSTTELRDQFDQAINTMLLVVTGLLGLAIVISLLGIANTLSLSVHERTRESAVLRALGLTRAQLRSTLTVEALVLGLVGAIVGAALGIVYGWVATKTLTEDVSFRLPVGQILAFIAASGLAGVLAAVLPARRAARASIVASLAGD